VFEQEEGREMRLNRKDRVRLARLEAAVETMEAPTREIFLMLRVDGLAYPEIGTRLGLSVADVEKGFAEAMVHLTRFMDEAEHGEGD
jgi:DNA-directed RNA polymerase specialized sigma24 family protein